MCGIAGIINLGVEELETSHIKNMLDTLEPRGPDATSWMSISKENLNKFYISNKYSNKLENVKLSMGTARLSIIDTSDNGLQPMMDDTKNIITVFNGEIYNFKEIRSKLVKLGCKFKSQSDSEIIPHAFKIWKENAFNIFNGQFAIAIFDFNKNELTLLRDRLGVKPLYFYKTDNNSIIFGSEIKAILAAMNKAPSCNIKKIINKISLPYKLQTIGDETFFDKIFKVPPGYFLKFNINNSIYKRKYWNFPGPTCPKIPSYSKSKESIKKLFLDSIKIRLNADRPLAFILSGGIDSSSIAGIAKKHFNIDSEAFSLNLPDVRFNENEQIKEILAFLKIKGNFIDVSHSDVLNITPNLINIFDEPVPTPNGILHRLLANKIVERGYRVALNGIGGDEIFLGYHDHFLYYLYNLEKNNSKRFLIEKNIWIKNQNRNEALYESFKKFIISKRFLINPDFLSRSKSSNYQTLLNKDNVFNNYSIQDPSSFPFTTREKQIWDTTILTLPHSIDMDDRFYLSKGLETRHPFLDYRLVEEALSLPDEYKINRGFSKFILRTIVRGFIPNTRRSDVKKIGLNLPIDVWMKTILKDWTEDNLRSKANLIYDYADHKAVNILLDEHLNDVQNHSLKLWDLINLNVWLTSYKKV